MNGAAPLWVVAWISAAILVPTGAIAAAAVIHDRRRGRRQPAVPRAAWEQLAALRPDTTRPAEPLDPCTGLGPIKAPDLGEAARRRAVTTLIATAGRYLR